MSDRPVSNPLDDLAAKLRADQDRRDELAIESRALAARITAVRDELRDLDLSIRATRGLLNLADAAQKQAAAKTDAKPDDPKPTTTATPAKRTSRKGTKP